MKDPCAARTIFATDIKTTFAIARMSGTWRGINVSEPTHCRPLRAWHPTLMSLATQSMAVSLAAVLLYIGLLGWAIMKRRLIVGAFGMLIVASLPIIWQALATDSEAKGEGILAVLLWLPALLVLAIGTVLAVANRAGRSVRKQRHI